MIDCLIFSKDRACQLDLLLRSIDRYAPGLYRTITILYTWSAPEYREGYQLAREQAAVESVWKVETNFERDVRDWLDTREPNDYGNHVSFLVDDDVFYRKLDQRYVFHDQTPLSLRGGDYGYPFSLDGNIYQLDVVLELMHGLHFTDPTELEHQGHLHRDRLPFARVVPQGKPCLVGVPANRVSASSRMPHMGEHEYDLNERYLNGERLALIESDANLGAHAYLALAFGDDTSRVESQPSLVSVAETLLKSSR